MVKKILFITLSNIGDVILSLPALGSLKDNFPKAEITVMAGSRAEEIFKDNPHIHKLIIYDKHISLKKNIMIFKGLQKERFGAVVDLRNTFFGAFLAAKYKTSPFLVIPKNITHMKDRHLYKVASCQLSVVSKGVSTTGNFLNIKQDDEKYIEEILRENNINAQDKIIVVAPGARSRIKRWPQDKFIELISSLAGEPKVKIILAGDKGDIPIAGYISGGCGHGLLDLSGKTTLPQLAYLLKKAGLVISNDSAILHLASYLNRPIVAIFGPTDDFKYGPWSDNYSIVKKEIFCRPCRKAQCRFGTIACMRIIQPEDVLRQVKNILSSIHHSASSIQHPDFKRILIVRTDRIGDVLLSTPVIRALRDSYPYAYLAMMVSPCAKEIVAGNPCLDEVIIYDKDAKHKNWVRSLAFARNLKKKRFNLAVILHPTNRVHLLTFFAGITRRLGYGRKLGFLLTDRIKHTKQHGEKHELDYNLDMVRYLGVKPQDKELFMPVKPEAEEWAEALFKREGISGGDRVLAIHPGASCVSKLWPAERFAELCEKLTEKYGFKVLLIAGPKDIKTADEVTSHMRHPAINLAGKISLSQLASVLKRCALFISNDSGPVHIASALGVPVISIFGRSQKGLSPRRWGPVGKKGKFLHKPAGCIKCLAHNCVKEFACLKAISVSDVLNAVDSMELF